MPEKGVLLVNLGTLVVPEKTSVGQAMRYGVPDMRSRLVSLRDEGVKKLIVLPLYPQYSVTTTESVFDKVTTTLTELDWEPERRVSDHLSVTGWSRTLVAALYR